MKRISLKHVRKSVLALSSVCTLFLFSTTASAQDAAAGAAALSKVVQDIATYIPISQKIVYVICAVIGIYSIVSIFFKMNNGEQDVKKSMMFAVGGCIFVAAATYAIPMFFGY